MHHPNIDRKFNLLRSIEDKNLKRGMDNITKKSTAVLYQFSLFKDLQCKLKISNFPSKMTLTIQKIKANNEINQAFKEEIGK